MWSLRLWVALLTVLYTLQGFQYFDTIHNAAEETVNVTDFLGLHNHYRRMVRWGQVPDQPKPQSLPDMKWNDYLKQMAEKWAEKCIFQHDPDKNFGENIAFATYSRFDAVKTWFDEHSVYPFIPIGNGLGVYGHYTQLVWAKSIYLGCVRHFCSQLRDRNRVVENAYYYVCKYYPKGNYYGQYPYIKSN